MKCGWREGNQIQLLENGDQFYPAVFEAIAQAQQKIILETFILFEDEVGKKLHAALLKAAQRGVKAEVLLDGYGSPDLSDAFVGELTSAGVIFRYYDPRPRLLGLRTNIFRRMHRKIVVIDDRIAFVGGINYSAEHMSDYGPQAKQDYAVRVEGPVVADILQFEVENLPGQSPARRWWKRHHQAEENRHPGEAQALFVWRDNEEHRDDIERHYLKMLTQAKREVIIANAYFFPGYRLLHAMRKAARRGVSVKLIVQGEPDMPIVKVGARLLYNYLAKRQVMLVSFVCYAFNLTLSTWVGGIGMRYRLYSRLGLPGSTITRIFSLSITTNWLGYILLGGIIFTFGVVQLPDHWYIDEGTLRILGIVLLLIIAVYLWFCAFAKRRHMTIKGQKLVLPSWKFALAQMAISSANWMAMGAIIWLLMGQDVNYFFVLGVLLVSSIAGVIVHIPAGIGVLEAVFLALLAGEHTSQGTIIAALLAYRVLYYFIPLLLALVCYLILESRAKKLRAKNERAMAK
ncbi:phospholipase [Salmonella enterica subsp. enterica serovar Typhi]|nr:phospholipase [Salmonella enterica subsp. enterica serovar Typhi]